MTDTILIWAHAHIAANPLPDFTVYDPDGLPQLERWYIVPRNDTQNVYLHRFLRSDDGRALHDHRGNNKSWLLEGCYRERLADGSAVLRWPGDIVERLAATPHRVEILDGQPAISLFFIGPIVRDWGFYCPDRWVPWQEFVTVVPGGNGIGQGCG
jgi:hypothetical protein